MIVFKMAVISTTHIMHNDSDILVGCVDWCGAVKVADTDCGFIFVKPVMAGWQSEMRKAKLSEAAVRLFEYAFNELGVDYLKLDCDGNTVGHLPTFEWQEI